MIRRFENKDAEKCSEIIFECIEKSLSYEGENKRFMIEMSSPENLIEKSKKRDLFVFEEDKIILGTGGLDKDEIKTMFVNPSFQKRGIGSKILNFLIDFAKTKGYSRAWCKASPEAEIFYSKNGFKKIRDDYEYDFHSIIMEKKLEV